MEDKKRSRPPRPRSLGNKLSPKQAAFAHHYTNPNGEAFGNATRATQLAGYAGEPGSNQLSVQGCRNLQNSNIHEAIGAELRKLGFTPKYAAKLLMNATRATQIRVLPGEKGQPTARAFPDHRTRMQALEKACRLLEKEMDPARAYNPRPLPEAAKRILPEVQKLSRETRWRLRDSFNAFENMSKTLGEHAQLVPPGATTMADVLGFGDNTATGKTNEVSDHTCPEVPPEQPDVL